MAKHLKLYFYFRGQEKANFILIFHLTKWGLISMLRLPCLGGIALFGAEIQALE